MKKAIVFIGLIVILAGCATMHEAVPADRSRLMSVDYEEVFDRIKTQLFNMGCAIKTLQKDEGFIEAWKHAYSFFGTPVTAWYRIMLLKQDDGILIRAQIILKSGPAQREAPSEYYQEFWGG